MDSIRPPIFNKPKNRIEAALIGHGQGQNHINDPYLPQIKKHLEPEPLKVIQESIIKSQSQSKPKKFPKIFRIIKPALILVCLFAVIGLVVYGAYQGVIKYGRQSDSQNMIGEIKKIIKTPLPQNEIPTVVTVANLEALKDQPIFKNAKVGDTLLIFTKAKRAILYRASDKSIIADAILTQ